MKRYLYVLLGIIMAFSCSRYDDAWIREELEKQKEAVSELEDLCLRINDNISAIEEIVTTLEEKDFIKSFSPITENGKTVGYELIFQKKGVVRLYYAQDGNDGEDGADAGRPVVSVKKDKDGKWYWTIDGEWCRDKDGNKVPAISNDDVTPSFRIEDGYWYVSYDGGKTWEKAGTADGSDGDLMFSDISFDDYGFYLTMSDGSVIELPLTRRLSIELGDIPSYIKPGSTFSVDYRIKGGSGKAEIVCAGEYGWSAKVSPASADAGKIRVTAPDILYSGKIIIFVSEGDASIMKAIVFDGAEKENFFMSSESDYYEFDCTGGYVDVRLTVNQDYIIEIPDDAQSWISHIETRSLRTDRIRLGIAPNAPGNPSRKAVITFRSTSGKISILIYQKAAPFIDSETDLGLIDGYDDPENGITVLQQASVGTGTDIVIMGDGFVKKHFVPGGIYETLMRQAYEDFFSVEPYTTLKKYFNVYYINVLSEEEHDAEPYYDRYGSQNGAIQGNARTKLGTTFTPGSTSISGKSDVILGYATQAIQMKGGADGGKCSYYDAYERAHSALVIVLPNVNCYAGTCLVSWTGRADDDYADSYSIAYTGLGNDGTGRQCRYTLMHEAGGHGFGKVGDEYGSSTLTSFYTGEWYELRDMHDSGVFRNINELWTYEESHNWPGINWEYTTMDNVYWAELLHGSYGYTESEDLGIYKGAYGYRSMFCRPTLNSLMRHTFDSEGQFFNAISRWAIWYRLMKLTDGTTAPDFKSSLDEFIAFDRTLTIEKNQTEAATRSASSSDEGLLPLAPPVLLKIE